MILQPGYIPSMTFRLNVTRELLSLANHLINRLENPNAPPPPPTQHTSGNGASREAAGEVIGIAAAAIPTIPGGGAAGRPIVAAADMGEGKKFFKSYFKVTPIW